MITLENQYLFKKIKQRQNKLKGLSQYLCELESQLSLIFASSPNIIVFLSSDLEILKISDAVKLILGYEKEELIGKSVFDLVVSDDVSSVEKFFKSFRKKRSNHKLFIDKEIVTTWKSKTNKEKKLLSQFSNCVGGEGQFVGIISNSTSYFC